jgi:hypothetical protein
LNWLIQRGRQTNVACLFNEWRLQRPSRDG